MLRVHTARLLAPAPWVAVFLVAACVGHQSGASTASAAPPRTADAGGTAPPGGSRIRARHPSVARAEPTPRGAASEVEQAALVPGAAAAPVRVRIEVARTPVARERGLMYRRALEPDSGMLFVFQGRPSVRTFWMHDTFVPLDMIFMDEDLRVVGIVQNAEPQSDEPCEVAMPSLYVLEVPAGFAARHGVSLGARIQIEGVDGVDVPEGEDC